VQPSALTLSGVAVIGGTATATGTANFKVQVSNSFATPKTATKELSIAVSAVPAIAIGNVSVTLTASTGGAGFLSTKGSWTVTSSGNPLRITGISWFGFETNNRVLHGLWTRGYMSALDQNKAPDFSTLRIPFSNAMLKPGATTNSINFQVNPDLKDLTPLQVLDKIVGYCGQIGLRVIRGRHSAKADGYTGENVWFISGDAHFIEQRWIEDWVMLAKHYAGNATVIGADLFNEPKRTATWGNNAPLTDWNNGAKRCGDAILEASPNWLIIVEGVEKVGSDSYWWGEILSGVAAFPVTLSVRNKLVYSMYDYPASVLAQRWFKAADSPQNLGGVWDSHVGFIFNGNTAPLLLGGFGSKLATTVNETKLGYIRSSMAPMLDGAAKRKK